MRLAVVTQAGNTISGAEHALLELINRLPEGVSVSWFFFEDGDFAETLRKAAVSVTIIPTSERLKRTRRTQLSTRALFDASLTTYHLSRALYHDSPDLVLTNSVKAHIIGSAAARLSGIRCVNYIHDILEGRARSILRLMSRLCASARMTCSQQVQSDLGLPHTTVVYPVIDLDAFARLPTRDDARRLLGIPAGDLPVIGIVGRISRQKGQDRFVRIAARVLKHTDAHFCVVGSPMFHTEAEYVRELTDAVARYQLKPRITFVPWQQDMTNVYAALDVACNCSLWEPFGRTSLEALASGVPVICFENAGICEIFQDNAGGVAVPVADEEAFAQAVLSYLERPPLMVAARNLARSTASQLDFDTVYSEFWNVIDRVGSR